MDNNSSNKLQEQPAAPPSSQQRTSTSKAARSRAAGAARRGRGRGAVSAMQQQQPSPRRSTRTRSRSRSMSISTTSASVNGGHGATLRYEGESEDGYEDVRSVASSSATAATGRPSSARKPFSNGKQPVMDANPATYTEDDEEHQNAASSEATRHQQPLQQQRGRGTSFIQQSERPSQASLKDTSVNIATAFRQAAAGRVDLGTNTAALPTSQSMSASVLTSTSTSTTRHVVTSAYATTSASSVGFLSRAGDREVSVLSTNNEADTHHTSPKLSNPPSAAPSEQLSAQQQAPPSTAARKRKSRSSSTKARSTKDASWKPSKEELASLSTDEYTSEGAITTDPEDLTKYVENPWGKKVYTVEYEGFGRRNGRNRSKKRVKADDYDGEGASASDDDGEQEEILLDEEDIGSTTANAAASPATRKRDAAARRGRTPTRGRRGGATAIPSQTRNESVDEGSVLSNDDTRSQAPSQAGSQPAVSYYLHEPGASDAGGAESTTSTTQPGPTAPRHANNPEFKSAQQAGLVQTYSKAGNFQPYFAYSTTTVGGASSNGSKANLNGSAPLRARRDTTASTSTEGAGGGSTSQAPHRLYASRAPFLDDGGKDPSSTASFDQRGSEYDYAEEERMTAALLAARERGSMAKGIPEGRSILPDMLLTRNYGQQAFNRWNQHQSQKERELSLVSVGSDMSSEGQTRFRPAQAARHGPSQAKNQPLFPQGISSRLEPRRVPAPPPRESSAVPSEITTHTDLPPGNYQASSSSAYDQKETDGQHPQQSFAESQAKKKIVERLGDIIRGLFIMAYWAVVGPVKWAKAKDAQTLWKTAAAVLLVGLILGSIYEQNPVHSPSNSFIWERLPFTSSLHHTGTTFSPSDKLPSNFDEVIQRLVSLESSVRSVSESSKKHHTTFTEHSSLLRDSNRRLAGLEADFESERRKNTKVHDHVQKTQVRESDKIGSTLKGIQNKLDSLNDFIKSHGNDRKSDSSDLLKLKNEFGRVHKDFDAYKGRLDMLVSKTDAALEKERTIKLVREAIEDILPSRLAVNVDSKTGQVTVDPNFWQYLKSHFSAGNGKAGPASKGAISWDDFISSNSDKLRHIVHGEVNGQLNNEVREGAILSRKSFGDALERELRSLSDKLSQSTSEQIAHLSHEVDRKISTLQQKANEHGHKHASSPSIKLSSGQDVNSIVSSLIDEALSKYSKDVLGKPDFALYTAGGRVIPSLTSPSYEIRPSTFSGSLLARLTGSGIIRGKAPVTALHHDISTGQCWAINGSSGQLGILLSRWIYPSDVTVEHASKDVALDVSSAPKNFEAWGIVSDPSELDQIARLDSVEEASPVLVEGENKLGHMIRLVKGAYDINATKNIQTFKVDGSIQELKIPISAVVFKILDNHGNEHLSCLYRVRVGGELAQGEANAA